MYRQETTLVIGALSGNIVYGSSHSIRSQVIKHTGELILLHGYQFTAPRSALYRVSYQMTALCDATVNLQLVKEYLPRGLNSIASETAYVKLH